MFARCTLTDCPAADPLHRQANVIAATSTPSFDSSQQDQPTSIGLLVLQGLSEISLDRLFT